MKAVFNVVITKPEGGIKSAHKETEIDFLPVAGMQVEDGVWKDSVKVVSVCYGIESKQLFVSLEKHTAKNLQDQKFLIEMYRDHDWVVSEE